MSFKGKRGRDDVALGSGVVPVIALDSGPQQ